MSRWIAPFSVSETNILADRLELGIEPLQQLNADVISWLEHSAGLPHEKCILRFPFGTVFDVEAVEDLIAELLPHARFVMGSFTQSKAKRAAGIKIHTLPDMVVCEARTTPCALLAAFLRAYAATAAPDVARRAA